MLKETENILKNSGWSESQRKIFESWVKQFSNITGLDLEQSEKFIISNSYVISTDNKNSKVWFDQVENIFYNPEQFSLNCLSDDKCIRKNMAKTILDLISTKNKKLMSTVSNTVSSSSNSVPQVTGSVVEVTAPKTYYTEMAIVAVIIAFLIFKK